jgi:hypothetical protein
MDFLKYVEHSAENLQFFLWFKDYTKRFDQLPESESALSPEWTEAQEETEKAAYQSQLKQKPLAVEAKDILSSHNLATQEESPESQKNDPFNESQDSTLKSKAKSPDSESTNRPMSGLTSVMSGHSRGVEGAFEDAGRFLPCKFHQLHTLFSRELDETLKFFQSPYSLSVRKCLVSSPFISPTELHASSISLRASGPHCSMLSRSPPTHLPSATLSKPLNCLSAAKHTPILSGGPSAMEIDHALSSPAVLGLEASLLESSPD